ncbi:MAG: hypothetical protein ACKV0T_27530 [Planctomycetales bacterium]
MLATRPGYQSLVWRCATILWCLLAPLAPLQAQGRFPPVTDGDVLGLSLNHYFSADKKHHPADFEWTFTETTFLLRKGDGPIPVDLQAKLLPKGAAADEIRGRWKLDEKDGPALVLTKIQAGDKEGRPEVRLPIYRTAPTVIRIGEPQYVFAFDQELAANPQDDPPEADQPPKEPPQVEALEKEPVELRSWVISPGLNLPESKHLIHWIRLKGVVNDKGIGRGTLTLDPNPPAYDEYGDFLTGREAEPRVEPLEPLPNLDLQCVIEFVKEGFVPRVNEAPTKRKIYRLKGPRIKSSFSFTTAGPGFTSGRLLVHNKKGQVAFVVEMQELKPVDPNLPLPPCHPGCFPAGTKILTLQGVVPIEQIRVGHLVTCVDRDGAHYVAPVTGLFTTRNRLVEIRTKQGNLLTTQTQPLALVAGGFQPAGELEVGDRIWRWKEDARHPVEVSEVHPTDQEVPVFNLVVGDLAMFVAGDFVVRGKPPADVEPVVP